MRNSGLLCMCAVCSAGKRSKGIQKTEFWYWFKDKMEELLHNYNTNHIHDIYFFGHNNLIKLLSVCVHVCSYSVAEVRRGC